MLGLTTPSDRGSNIWLTLIVHSFHISEPQFDELLGFLSPLLRDPPNSVLVSSRVVQASARTMANPNQYFLLADHIKLSLLERQRAISLNLEPTSQDGHISRSLDSLREGLEGIVEERIRLQEAGDIS